MRKSVIAAVLVFSTLARHGAVQAGGFPRSGFDGRRRGAIAAVALGGGYTHISSKNGDLWGSTGKGTMVLTFHIGYAPNEQLELYAFYRAAAYADKLWEHVDDIVDRSGSSEGITHAILLPFVPVIAIFSDQHVLTGIGTTYYFVPGTHAWFVEAGVGPSVLFDPWEEEGPSPFPDGADTGIGFFAGIGYEFSRHYQASLEFMWSRATWERSGVEKSWTGASVMMTLRALVY